MRIFEHIRVTVRLNASEQYKRMDANGKPFIVEQIQIGGTTATLRGTAIKLDGSAALHNREITVNAEELPAFISSQVLQFMTRGRTLEPTEESL